MPSSPYRVFLIDDHPIVEAGLRLGFELSDEFKLIGTAVTHDQALGRVEELQPDIIVSDLVINGHLDLSYLSQYREIAPEARLMAFSSLPQDAYAEKCRTAGADGYIAKSTSPHELVARLKEVVENAQRTTPSAVNAAGDKNLIVDGVSLTQRESEVGRRLAQGQSVQDIATSLGISKKTAAIHRDNLRGKLNCASSYELTALLARRVNAVGA
jgi:two-component system NarL family response regulator